ncbi:MAG TPA: cell division protein FtsZ [bacterium]
MKTNGQALTFDFVEQARRVAKIRVVGVGGAGGNAINRMIEDQMVGVDFIAVNTDLQALDQNLAPTQVQIGKTLTRGLGSGGHPDVGRKAIEENKDAVQDLLSDSDMVFITCGMGGGTGTGAAPVVAEIARDAEALTVGIVTSPFAFEGAKRMEKADQGIQELKEYVDTLIVVPNQKLLTLVPKNMPLQDAFRVADEILLGATRGISDVINVPGLINLDFADVKTVMSNMGDALMGSGAASGDNRGKDAAEKAISSQLIDDVSIMGAKGVLVNITGGKDLSLTDINEATSVIYEASGNDALIIFGAVIDPDMNGELRVTVIATGFQGNGHRTKPKSERELKRRASDLTEFTEGLPIMQDWKREPAIDLADVFGGDSAFSFSGKDNLNVPTFLRNRRI